MVRRLPPLNALRAFEAAARLGSFARAADELAVTPTAISHQIRGLEEWLGVELFVRMARGLRLSDAGARYMPELTKGFDALARAGEQLNGDAMAGILHVDTLASFAHCWLVPRMNLFHDRYPQITLRISATLRHVDFLGDDVDVAIRYGRGQYPGLRAVKVMEEDVFPVASPALLASGPPLNDWPDLASHTLLHDYCAEDAEPWISWQTWLRYAGVEDRVSGAGGLEFDNSAMLIDAAVRGHGVAIGRTALVAEHLREGRLVTLFNARHPADYAYYAVAPEASADQPKVRAFIAWLKHEVARDAEAPAITAA